MKTDVFELLVLVPTDFPSSLNYIVTTSGLQEEVGEVFFKVESLLVCSSPAWGSRLARQ